MTVMNSADDSKPMHRADSLFSSFLKNFSRADRIVLDMGDPSARGIEVLTFEDVVRYFIESRPADPRIAAGALLKQRRRTTNRYLQFFLDDNDQPVLNSNGIAYGRALEAARMDEELTAVFANHDNDLLIFR
jgi:hypothetical protein